MNTHIIFYSNRDKYRGSWEKIARARCSCTWPGCDYSSHIFSWRDGRIWGFGIAKCNGGNRYIYYRCTYSFLDIPYNYENAMLGLIVCFYFNFRMGWCILDIHVYSKCMLQWNTFRVMLDNFRGAVWGVSKGDTRSLSINRRKSSWPLGAVRGSFSRNDVWTYDVHKHIVRTLYQNI